MEEFLLLENDRYKHLEMVVLEKLGRFLKLNKEFRKQKNWATKRFLFPTSTKFLKESSELK